MKTAKLVPGDIILFKTVGKQRTLWHKAKAWFTDSDWEHVSIFWGVGKTNGDELMQPYSGSIDIPLHVEAIERGTLKTDLRNSKGRYIKVLRCTNASLAHRAALRSGKFAHQGKRWYDYWCIIRYVIPFLKVRKFFGVECGFGYQHNDKFICSEQADAAYFYRLFTDNRRFPTLPGDYEYSELLKTAYEGVY